MIEQILIPTFILGGMGLVFGLGLAYTSKKFEVVIDERVSMVRELLPGVNCGACGKTGCDGFAQAVVDGSSSANGCPVSSVDKIHEIGKLLGKDAAIGVHKTARVMCGGSLDKSVMKYEYSGIQDCAAVSNLHGGPLACSYGCVGLGNCVRACPFDAIVIQKGLAIVIQDRCKSCEKCIAACPKKIIHMVTRCNEYTVMCSSLDKGNVVRKNCSVGCIGCGMCIKACPEKAISLRGTLAEISPELCKNCGACIKVCPTKAIKKFPS